MHQRPRVEPRWVPSPTTPGKGEYRIGFPENVVDIYLYGDTPKETAAAFSLAGPDELGWQAAA